MRILLAGATGAVGRLLTPMLVEAGHTVHAFSRTEAGLSRIAAMGAIGETGDVLDAQRVADVMAAVRPAVVVNQVTDLAGFDFAANARARRDGTHNLVAAALDNGVERFVTQSIAWAYRPGVAPADEAEPLDLDADEPRRTTVGGVAAAEADVARVPEHVVLRYGLFYGPGTWHAADGAYAEQVRAGTFTASGGVASFVHVADAAAAAVAALAWPSGVVNVVDDDPAPGADWVDELRRGLGADSGPALRPAADWDRGADNSRLHELGFALRFPTWRGRLTSN